MAASTDFFQKLNDQITAGKPFVVYKKPGATLVKALLQQHNATFKNNDLSLSGFVFAPFDTEEDSYLIPSEESETINFEFLAEAFLDNRPEDSWNSGVDFEFMEEDQKIHEKLVQKGIDAVKNGNFQKVVLARSEKVQLYDPNPVRIFKDLLNKYSQAFVYLWFHPETGYWLGATPETLLYVERDRFKTMALAGTQVYKGKIDVEWRNKEVEEQQFVTDYILDSLERVKGVESVQSSKPYSEKAGNLLHIRTDISGKLKNADELGALVKAIHPTPAVCGLPKRKALDFILEHENYPREFYSGYLGEVNMKSENKRNSNRRNQENQQFAAISKKTNLFVNLRCMKLKDGNARIFIGGGITRDSNAADEWMETVNKAQTMKAVLVK
ncbi:chorismate-binding protein [Christiangramia sp.]|uniref:chorismate-binding protein n=1 Tax=Christiangramia sp. TaxID=1931228 RepID=UPI002608D9EB|nr:chorismate-binding protein [Christiangramia sp.]